MANTSARTLRLLSLLQARRDWPRGGVAPPLGISSRGVRSLLQARRYWPGEDLPRQLGISPRTLRRDVDRLRELGYPIEAQRGVAGGYQLAGGSGVRPPGGDDEEGGAP